MEVVSSLIFRLGLFLLFEDAERIFGMGMGLYRYFLFVNEKGGG